LESKGFQGKYRILVPQEFLRKIPEKTKKKQEFLQPLQNHVPVKNSSGKRRKKEILRNHGKNGFLGPKNKFLKTGIGSLENKVERERIV